MIVPRGDQAIDAEDVGDERRARPHAVAFLAPVYGPLVLVHGHVDLVPATASSVLPFVQTAAQGAGKGGLRIIAIAAPQRAGGILADVPTWRADLARLRWGVDAMVLVIVIAAVVMVAKP